MSRPGEGWHSVSGYDLGGKLFPWVPRLGWFEPPWGWRLGSGLRVPVAPLRCRIFRHARRLLRPRGRPVGRGHPQNQKQTRRPKDHHVCMEPQGTVASKGLSWLQFNYHWASILTLNVLDIFSGHSTNGVATLSLPGPVLRCERWAQLSALPKIGRHGPRSAFQHCKVPFCVILSG